MVLSPESCLAYLLPTQIVQGKSIFLCRRDTDTKAWADFNQRINVIHRRQTEYHSSVPSLLSISFICHSFYLSVLGLSFFNFYIFLFSFFTSCQSISPEGTPAFLPSFLPSCFLLYLPSLPPSSQIALYLPETLSVSSWLIFSRLIWLEHAKLINMVWSGLTYHRTICTYITHTCSHPPPNLHTRSYTHT